MAETIVSLVIIVSNWVVFTKMGVAGWKSLIPFYNLYILFDKLYGEGFRFLLLLIPIYNIYLVFKFNIDLAKAFNKEVAFGVGLTLVNPIFIAILAFGSAEYKDGSFNQDDTLSGVIQQARDKFNGEDVYDSIRKLDRLHEDGLISDEEYQTKKEELLSRI